MIRNKRIRTTATDASTRSAAIHLVQSSQFAQRLARALLVVLVVSIIAMMFLTWQQTSRGAGQVVAFVPQERQQTVQSPVKGIVERIAEGLVEGSPVKKGDFILELQPVSANLPGQLEGQLGDLKTKLDSAEAKAEAYELNIVGFTEARDFAVSAATDMVDAARAKLEAKTQLVSAYRAKELQARLNYERQNALFESGIRARKEIEKLKKEWDVAKAELESVQQDVGSLRNELKAKQNELEEKRRVAQTKIDYARAMKQDAIGSAATVRKDIRDVEIKLGELDRQKIVAPRDGTIFRMPIFERGQTIKENESLLTIVPEVSQKAVELMVAGNDMPLIQIGQEVRLQFEGWPALQIAGWPSVAIGTFSGVVATIDATDNGKGQFRILVTPNEADNKVWPSDQFLRQGVRVNGWVVMRQVSLGFEIWRQLNGFPITPTGDDKGDKIMKPPKVPK